MMAVLACGAAQAQAACTQRTTPVPVGLKLLETRQLDSRTTLYTFRSAAVGAEVKARVIVPAVYAQQPDSRFPLLMNLHGTGGDATVHKPEVWQEVLGDAPIVFVEPDGGAKGFYTDWWGSPDPAVPAPGWETFHLRELLPWIEAHFRTTGRRAVSGGSMGGFGAMSYAARNPGVFKAAAASSGALDSELLYPVGSYALAQIYDPCIWGDPVEQRAVWQAHNPTALVAKLRGVALFVAVGNGLPGRHDTTLPDPQAPLLEVATNLMTRDFVAAADAAGIPVTSWFYGNGTHPWTGYTTLNYDYDNMRRYLPIALAQTGRADTSCAATSARRAARSVGRAKLGRTRAQTRRAYPSLARRGRFDVFCLHDGKRLRVAYSANGRVNAALSDSPAHSVAGVNPGDSAAAVRRRPRIARLHSRAYIQRAADGTWRIFRLDAAARRVSEVGLAVSRAEAERLR